jgi:hypothetical protein
MKAKKIIAIVIMACTLELGILGCENQTVSNTSELSNRETTIEYEGNNILSLVAEETEGIKGVAEKYGVSTVFGIPRGTLKERKKVQETLRFSKDKYDVSDGEGWEGCEIDTRDEFNPDDSGISYTIKYKVTVRLGDRVPDENGKLKVYDINGHDEVSFVIPEDLNYKIDEAPFMKDLLYVQLGEDYDISVFEKKVQECITKSKESGNEEAVTVDLGKYEELIRVGTNGYGTTEKGKLRVTHYVKMQFVNK